MKGYVIIHHPS